MPKNGVWQKIISIKFLLTLCLITYLGTFFNCFLSFWYFDCILWFLILYLIGFVCLCVCVCDLQFHMLFMLVLYSALFIFLFVLHGIGWEEMRRIWEALWERKICWEYIVRKNFFSLEEHSQRTAWLKIKIISCENWSSWYKKQDSCMYARTDSWGQEAAQIPWYTHGVTIDHAETWIKDSLFSELCKVNAISTVKI